MPTNKEVFDTVNDASREALRKRFGPESQLANSGMEGIPAQVAVAHTQCALLYFAMTGAPKAVVFDFFLDLMGVQGERATLEEKEGRLIIVPPKPKLMAVPSGGRKGNR